MTNTLHRLGTQEDLMGDFVVFITPTRSISPELFERWARFTDIVLKHNPVNVSKIENSTMKRVNSQKIAEEMAGQFAFTATYDSIEALTAVLADLKKADLGIPINVSGLHEAVRESCEEVGLKRHSTEQPLAVFGSTDKLPQREIVEINSMCGHGCVSFNLIKKVVDEIKTGRLSIEEGVRILTKPCECAAFNPTRAKRLLERLRKKQ